MRDELCSVCNSKMNLGLQSWHWECARCKYEKSTLSQAINETLAHEKINELSREKGLKSIRVENFNKLLKSIKALGKKTGNLLDVGCAHGWFIEAAEKQGFKVLGIEPDVNVYNATAQRGLPVRNGFFPQVLSSSEKFDVIVFNDVFEHIPDVADILNKCRSHLNPDGQLILNLPSSTGIFYRISKVLAGRGYKGFFERLWQKGLPSPHLHYFNTRNLSKLLQDNGFEVISTGSLTTLRAKGMFTRISYAGNHSLPIRLLIYILLILVVPFLYLMPSDIIYLISKKVED